MYTYTKENGHENKGYKSKTEWKKEKLQIKLIRNFSPEDD
jgi:hypothetical protein